jgi:hypothetical protein
VSLGAAALAWVSLIPNVRVGPGMLASGATVEAASRALVEALPRADGPQPVLDPSVGDGGVSAFYVWDKMVPGTPGKLLRQEPLASELMLVNAVKGLRILYSSTNGLDNETPIAVSGAIYFPKSATPVAGRPIIAWAHGTTGIADVCAPSWIPRSSRDADYLNTWLAQGYAVVATDYQGLGTPGGHPWLTVRPEAYSVLDSARAAIGAFPELSNSVVIVGQSQGAHAAISASLLAPAYATDIHLKGTVATGVPAHPDPPFAPATKAPKIPIPPQVAGALVTINLLNLLAYRIIDPSLNPSDYLVDAARPAFEAARTACLTDVRETVTNSNLTVENAFRKSLTAATAKAASYQQYPTPKFAQPVFIGSGLADTAAFPEGQYNVVMAACHAGSRIEAHYYPGQDHSGTVNASLVDSIPFVKKVLAGQTIAGNCRSVQPPPPRN